MKRIFAFLLVSILILSLAACGKGESTGDSGISEAPDGFSVGFARRDITPLEGVPLSGYGNGAERISNNVLYPLYVNCVAVTGANKETVLLIDVDLQRAYGTAVMDTAEPLIEEATGVPAANIVVTATHSHAAPDLSMTTYESIQRYITMYTEKLVDVCKAALEDRKPTTATFGSVETENLNFVKHYVKTLEDGSQWFFGDNFGSENSTVDTTTKHATDADQTLNILQFKREGGKDVVMANWRAHPLLTAGASKKDISSDYIGAFQLALEEQYDCYFAYYQGACGNINSNTRITSERRSNDCAEYGALLAGYALDCLANNMTPIETADITVNRQVLQEKANHLTDDMLMQAKEVYSYWNSTLDASATAKFGLQFGIRSAYQAINIIKRAARGETVDVEMYAISFGKDFAIATMPGEPFDTIGQMVEDNSPYAHTMFFAYTNMEDGYMPSAYGWEYTSYETDVSPYEPNSGERIAEYLVGMLNDNLK